MGGPYRHSWPFRIGFWQLRSSPDDSIDRVRLSLRVATSRYCDGRLSEPTDPERGQSSQYKRASEDTHRGKFRELSEMQFIHNLFGFVQCSCGELPARIQ